ncbi:hypothetical protein [Proteiniclasticum sp. QWL-01]|uniref:hypothetical protein n=1 Tax=Proteiniclasticum sp. QWL-01 TaxID=3036945 RepID=UPI0024105D3E|nr:hypothetical protein [Proteiniclasticum sp. QWL-01]WFF72628.1 hypothetical protein P6M73_15355 [Proteiniclasticum sp. QWL-01]
MDFFSSLFKRKSKVEVKNKPLITVKKPAVDENHVVEDDEPGTCEMCENLFPYSELHFDGEKNICEKCMEADDTVMCVGCERYFKERDLFSNDGEPVCEECHDANIPDYDYNGNADYWRDDSHQED